MAIGRPRAQRFGAGVWRLLWTGRDYITPLPVSTEPRTWLRAGIGRPGVAAVDPRVAGTTTRSACGRVTNSTGVVPRSRESARVGSELALLIRTNPDRYVSTSGA